jgi:ribosomal-protein-alanine N-acetyltransferase
MVERAPYGLWAVERLADGKLLGHCGLMQEPITGTVEMGYAIGRPHWGRGFASESARASLRYGFGRLELDRIIALAAPENTASRRVMEKAGMRFEGITGDYYQGSELALYSITRRDFVPGKDPYQVIDHPAGPQIQFADR